MTGLIIAIVVIAIVLIALFAFVMPRARARARERELANRRDEVATAHRERMTPLVSPRGIGPNLTAR